MRSARQLSESLAVKLVPVAIAVAVLLTGGPASAQPCDPRQLTCITGPRFLVRAYNGAVVRNGGKCLDYGAEVSGSPVFLNDCTVAHPIGVHELELVDGSGQPIRNNVVLVAGTKVIGLKRNPIAIGDGGPPAFVEPSEIALELQNPAVSGPGFGAAGPSLVDQTFALDGDSIILAANRDLVAKVQNARGRNGTPIVFGARRLAYSEFWEFQATDGSGDDPTDAFITIAPTFFRLGQYLGPNAIYPVQFGTVFKFREEVIILSEGEFSPTAASGGIPFPELRVPAGVTIRGDRRGTLFGPEFWMPTGYEGSMFVIAGSDTRITGLRIRGTNVVRDTDEELKHIRTQGVHAPEEHARTHIDNNDISDWNWAGVRVEGEETGDDSCSQNPSLPPQTRPNNVRVVRNFLHHHVVSDRGYGVSANSGGFPLIEGNTFVSNRHAIAGTNSTTNTGYRAWSNIVLSAAPLQHGLFHTHDFDMHGTGDNGFCGIAGGYMDLFGNTFLGTNRANFKLRGTNCQSIPIRDNVFLQDQGDAVEFDNILYPWETCSSTARFLISPHPEQFDLSNPMRHFGVGDFDGDGMEDLFLATGTAFYYAPGGSAEWRLLTADRTDRMGSLLFGDFDADGRTDVVAKKGGNLLVSWGGISEWEWLNSTNAGIADLAVGNFDGLPGDDIFHANGRDWLVSSGGSGEFLFFNTSGFRVRDLRFGDFDGIDGKTDVFGVVSGSWSVSYGATSAWTALRPRLTDTVNGLFVADFNGDGRDDIGQATFTTLGLFLEWRFSNGGVDNWIPLTSAVTGLAAGIGHFRGDPKADVLVWDPVLPFPAPGPRDSLDAFYFGSGGLHRHSTQAMR